MQPTKNILLLLAAAATFAATASAQHVIRTMNGDQAGANFGRVLATVGDVDGDGTTDLLIGQPQRDVGGIVDAGAADLVRTGAWVLRTRTFGSSPGGRLGGSLAGLGDVDGDTLPDWACGSPDALTGIGTVRVMSSGTGLQLHQLTGEPFARFGAAICAIGDRNNDGHADFAVGSPVNTVTTPNGAVRFYSGLDGSLLTTLSGGSNTAFGSGLATLGDLTGDGQPEIAIGEPDDDTNATDAGNVRIKNPRDGNPSSWFWQANHTFGANQHGGTAVAALGDIDGDGKSELLVATSVGVVHVMSGIYGTLISAVVNNDFGPAPRVAGIGDWDGDGVLDFAVGNPNFNLGAGRVWIHSTGTGLPLLATIDGGASSGFGSALVGVGDLDGDGRADLAVGAPTAIIAGLVMGRVTVHAFDIQPALATFGQGCAGSVGTPDIYFAGSSNAGETFHIQCGNLRQNAFGYLLFGLSNTSAGGVPLPFALQPFGLPCTLYVSLDAPEPFATSNATYIDRPMTLPNAASLATFEFYVQACQFDSAAPGGVAFSNAGRIRVGNL